MKIFIQVLQANAPAFSRLGAAGTGLHYFKKLLYSYAAAILVVAGTAAVAQAQHVPGANDPTFNTADVIDGIEGFNSFVTCIAVQPDGKTIVGGNFFSYNGTRRNRIARLNVDGTLDTTFDPGSDFYSGFNGSPQALVIQNDGKIVVGGSFLTYNYTIQYRIVRLNPDGSVDESFTTGTGFSGAVSAIALQSDGKIVAGGAFSTYNGTTRNRMARLNSDGTLDETFSPEVGISGSVQSIQLQSDGKMVVGGSISYYNGTAHNSIARLNANGSRDETFNLGSGFNGYVTAVVLQPDGKVVAGGYFTFFNGTACNRIARLNSDGTLDNSFNPGAGFNGNVSSLALQSDGKIVAGGSFISYNGTAHNSIVRLNTDGSTDTSFNTGAGMNGYVAALALHHDEKLIVGGQFTSYNNTPRFRITSINSDGSLGSGFNHRNGFSGAVSAITLQPDGKLLVGGEFEFYNGLRRLFISRLNTDGTVDDTFNYSAGLNGSVEAITMQNDGKIVVGGRFGLDNAFRIARLHNDGSLDVSFAQGFNGTVTAIVPQKDGKLIVGGTFTISNGMDRNRIVRLHANGSLDYSFIIGSGFDAPVQAIALQSDGKILVGGGFTSYNGTACNGLVRLNTDGTLDNSFSKGSILDGSVNSILLQPDGKIVVGGGFATGNSASRTRIARLNADGSLDNSFDPGTGFDGAVSSIVLQSDGKLVVGGWYTSYNGTSRNRIARLNANGTLDASFNPGDGFNNFVNTIALQHDGKVVVGGEFTSFNGIVRNRIARLHGGEGTSLSAAKELQAGLEVLVYPNPTQGDISLVISGAEAMVGAEKLTLHDTMGRQVLTKEVSAAEVQDGIKLKTSTLADGIYFLKISTRSGNFTKRLVVGN